MTSEVHRSDYDGFAWFYDRHWGDEFSARVLPVVEKLLLSRLPPGGRILDLCCGMGRLAAALGKRGFSLTGVDASKGMLRFARGNAPSTNFFQADARSFHLPA